MEVREIGHWNVLEEDSVSDVPVPIFANLPLCHRQPLPKAIRDSIETNSGLKPELVGAEESSTDGASMVV